MKIRILSIILCLAISLSLLTIPVSANEDDIIILYENDVHCEVEGYSKLAALKNELKETYAHVGVVSSGDYIQGGSLGSISKGEYIVNLMNLVGYDAVTIGNHEFDYHITRLDELSQIMNTKPICCNFRKIGEEDTHFEPYSIVSYGDIDIAYIGIVTPRTATVASNTSQFKDENGNLLYDFHATDLSEVVQKNIDEVKAQGADYVIVLSHLGDNEQSHTIQELVGQVSGIDVVLDAHSHSVIENRILVDKSGENVILTSTGTKFEYIGKLTISDGNIKTELIKTSEYTKTDPVVDAYLAQINEEYSTLGGRLIGQSDAELIMYDENGKRISRIKETTLGDFCSDAIRIVMDSDIGFIGGGAMRSEIRKGDVTFNSLLSMFPFNNHIVVLEVSGQIIKDMLEMSLFAWPEEGGAFPHMSGLTFSVDTSLESSVILDENGMFTGVGGEYRVYDIKVLNKETNKYEPLVLTDTYSFAGSDYFLIDCGDGLQMFNDAKVISNPGILDIEVIEAYLVEHLNGKIGENYNKVVPNITFTNGKTGGDEPGATEAPATTEAPGTTETPDGEEDEDYFEIVILIAVMSVAFLTVAVISIVVLVKSNKRY